MLHLLWLPAFKRPRNSPTRYTKQQYLFKSKFLPSKGMGNVLLPPQRINVGTTFSFSSQVHRASTRYSHQALGDYQDGLFLQECWEPSLFTEPSWRKASLQSRVQTLLACSWLRVNRRDVGRGQCSGPWAIQKLSAPKSNNLPHSRWTKNPLPASSCLLILTYANQQSLVIIL